MMSLCFKNQNVLIKRFLWTGNGFASRSFRSLVSVSTIIITINMINITLIDILSTSSSMTYYHNKESHHDHDHHSIVIVKSTIPRWPWINFRDNFSKLSLSSSPSSPYSPTSSSSSSLSSSSSSSSSSSIWYEHHKVTSPQLSRQLQSLSGSPIIQTILVIIIIIIIILIHKMTLVHGCASFFSPSWWWWL